MPTAKESTAARAVLDGGIRGRPILPDIVAIRRVSAIWHLPSMCGPNGLHTILGCLGQRRQEIQARRGFDLPNGAEVPLITAAIIAALRQPSTMVQWNGFSSGCGGEGRWRTPGDWMPTPGSLPRRWEKSQKGL